MTYIFQNAFYLLIKHAMYKINHKITTSAMYGLTERLYRIKFNVNVWISELFFNWGFNSSAYRIFSQNKSPQVLKHILLTIKLKFWLLYNNTSLHFIAFFGGSALSPWFLSLNVSSFVIEWFETSYTCWTHTASVFQELIIL